MAVSILLRIVVLSLLLCLGTIGRAQAVVAYVFPQNQIIQTGEIAVRKLTRINYAFANIKDGRMVEGFSTDAQNFALLEALKKQNLSLTVLVSVGGWLWSGNFSDMTLTRESRAVFIQSAVDFIERYHLDGLDVDWEYPGLPGAGNHFRPEDKQNYTLLLKELRERFSSEEKTLHRRLYLTVAAGATSDVLAHTEMGEAQKYVDTVNLMTYDYYEPDSDKTTGNPAPLFTDPCRPQKKSPPTDLFTNTKQRAFPQKKSCSVFHFTDMPGRMSPM
jgi:chitinase